MMYSFIPIVEEILEQNQIIYTDMQDIEHITINSNEIMFDPGFGADNKMLDIYVDDVHHILFIGLLRLPKQHRGQSVGTQIVDQIKDWADRHGYTVFLDSCGDSLNFWSKCGFRHIEHQYGFDIMGFGCDPTMLKEKWKDGKKIFTETH